MLITFTPNPSLDKTVTIAGPLVPGQVHRIQKETVHPGGKGINVGLGVARAGVPTLAVFPANPDDVLLTLLDRGALPYLATPREAPARMNLTIISAHSTTTKVNEPGARISEDELQSLIERLLENVGSEDQVMMCGVLAPGMPPDLYGSLVTQLRQKGAWVGVDAADETLMSLVAEFPAAAPNLLKPNAHELGQVAGLDGDELEFEAANGELARVIRAAHDLRAKGVEEVLVSLGSAGAVLACPEGTWYSPSPDVSVVSTVGAGDSLVAGYLIGKHQLLPPPRRLALAVAYGAAAVSMPGTSIPTPDQVANFSSGTLPNPERREELGTDQGKEERNQAQDDERRKQ